MSNLRGRWLVIIAAVVAASLWVSPNFVNYEKTNIFAKNKMILGLDIQGGLHLVMGVDVQAFIQESVAREVPSVRERLTTDGIKVSGVSIAGADKDRILVATPDASTRDAVVKYVNDRMGTQMRVESQNDQGVTLAFFDAVILEMKKQVVGQAIEVIRNRIDEFGVSEPSITAQGSDRILVQLPGVKDPLRAKELINRTARLDFRVVSAEMPFDKLESLIAEAEKKGAYKLGENELGYAAYVKRLNEDLAKDLPPHTKIVFEKLENATTLEAGKRAFLVNTDIGLGGNLLQNASVRPDEMGKPEVNFSFNPEGRRLFAELTAKAAGGLIAIVLDDVVKSAPRVEREIDSDSARITLGGVRDFQAAQNEASFIATSLRAGALPAALTQLEERTVGPSLGGDAVEKAKRAAIAGTLVVLLFLALYYRAAGLVADLALMLNFFFTFAILTSLGSTLTLPGIAGLALTVGMSVDANIVIFERIKEELRKGASQAAALKEGFANSYSAVFDSNITAILTCVVLMFYGTGPIRGFAITLMTGIICSMFTAVFVSRTVLDTLIVKLKLNVLPAQKV